MLLKACLRELVSRLSKEDMEMVEDIVNDFSSYIKKVADMENAINVARFRMEGQEYRDHITNLDTQRRIAHNASIVRVKVLNRLCKLNDLDSIYTGDIDNRNEVAEFCMVVTKELFDERELFYQQVFSFIISSEYIF